MDLRNSLTKGLADTLYLRLDTSNDPLTGNLEIQTTAPTITLTDTTGGDDNYQISLDGDDLTITNLSSSNGFIVLDHFIELFPNIPNTAVFVSTQNIINQPTISVGAVSNYSVFRDLTVATMGGIFSSFGVITAQPTVTNNAAAAGAVYLFISQGISKSTNVLYPPASYRSFDHRGIVEADGVVVPNCDNMTALMDIGQARAINSGTLVLDSWITSGNASVPGLGVVSATVGASATVTDRIVCNAVDTALNGDGGTEVIVNQYGLKVGALTTATTINCGAWIDGASGAVSNFGIVLNSDLADGGAIWFGGSQDTKMYYDGTDFNLLTDLQNPSDFVIDCGTDKTVELTETVWDDLRVPLVRGLTGALNPPSATQFMNNGAGSVGVYAWAFGDQAVVGNEEQMFFDAQLSHRYKQGTDIDVHIHWSPAVSGAAGEFVKWGLEYTWANIDGTFGNTTIITSDATGAGTATTSGDGTLTADKHYVTEIGTISGTGKNISSMLICRIFRNSSHADDDLTQDAFAFEVDFHFQIDTMGSRQEYVK